MTEKNTQFSYNDDEIDLIELILSIWQKKWWVVLIVVIFAVGSIGYALMAKEQWTSRAEIIAPNIKEMGKYLDTYEKYFSIINQNQNQNQNQAEIASKVLLNGFSSAIGSHEQQVKFFQQSEILKKQIKQGKKASSSMLQLINAVKVAKPNEKKGVNYIAIAFSSGEAAVAQQTLGRLIQYINIITKQELIEDLQTEIATKIKTLQIKKDSVKLFADTTEKVRLKNLQRALLTAKNAGIVDYSQVRGERFVLPGNFAGEAGIQLQDNRLSEGNFLFMLGEKYLKAQIDTLTNTTTVYPEEYYQAALQIDLLTELLNDNQDFSFDTFHYQSSPNLPLKRDKPKRGLIVLMGTFLGGIIGILIALFIAALEKRKIGEKPLSKG